MDQGYTADEIGAVYSYLYLFGVAIQIVFAIVVIVGLVKLAKQQWDAGVGSLLIAVESVRVYAEGYLISQFYIYKPFDFL